MGINLIESIYARYGKLLYSIAYSILCNKEDTNDAVQQSFIKIIKYEHKISNMTEKHIKSYISIIAKNEAINIYNKDKHVTNLDEEMLYNIEDESEQIDEILGRAELQECIYKYINLLSNDEKNIIILKYIHDQSYDEISDLLDLKNDAARQRVCRAKKKLADMISKDNENEKR